MLIRISDVLMKVLLLIKEKLQQCFFAAFIMAFIFSWPLIYYSVPKYEIEPHLSLYLFVPTLIGSTIVFLPFISFVWGCIEGLVWLIRKYRLFTYCKGLVKEIAISLSKDKGKHLLLHLLLLAGNNFIQLAVNKVSIFLNSVPYSFSLPPALRVFDTFVCYLIMLLLAYLYLKVTRCNTKSLVYYGLVFILPCIITALGIEWVELMEYKNEFCSDFGEV